MKPEDLKKLLQQPESETLEFKVRIPDTRHIVSNLVAFANTNGGKLIIGIDENQRIVGIDNIEHARRVINKAANTVSPPLKINIQTLEVKGKKVLVVEIPKGDKSPYFTGDRAWQRVGASNVPLTSEILFSNVSQRSTNIKDLIAETNRLSSIIEKLNKELISARSWKIKIVDMVIGGSYRSNCFIVHNIGYKGILMRFMLPNRAYSVRATPSLKFLASLGTSDTLKTLWSIKEIRKCHH